jgi:hypothetical protein
MKRIDVTCGYREEYPNGTVHYYGDSTNNGYCYKDMEAWRTGEGVCYIGEHEFEKGWCCVNYEGNTRDEIIADMAECLPGCDVKLIEQCAEYVLQTCDWESPTTMMMIVDWEEDIREVYKEGTEVYWLDPAGETSQEYIVSEFVSEEMVRLSKEGSECEALLSEVYRKSDKVCKHCGGPLYHEKYDNTQDHYPYVCFECDENFFGFEAR